MSYTAFGSGVSTEMFEPDDDDDEDEEVTQPSAQG